MLGYRSLGRNRERKEKIWLNLENSERKKEGLLKDSCEDRRKGRTSSNSETFGFLDLFSLGKN